MSFEIIDVVPPKSSSAVLVTKSSKSVLICNPFHARRVNSGKITISYEVSLFDAFVRGKSLYLVARYLVQEN